MLSAQDILVYHISEYFIAVYFGQKWVTIIRQVLEV